MKMYFLAPLVCLSRTRSASVRGQAQRGRVVSLRAEKFYDSATTIAASRGLLPIVLGRVWWS